MDLLRIDETEYGDNSELTSISAGTIYYITQGRNAWHSTWVTEYDMLCMHTTFESARRRVERIRKQGSVFHIRQLPVLVLESGFDRVLITEINTDCPLQDYSLYPVRFDVGKRTIDTSIPQSLTIGTKISQVVSTFAKGSDHWSRGYKLQNSVISLFSSGRNPIEKRTRRHLILQSRSSGRDYYLDWQPLVPQVSARAITRIVKIAHDASCERESELGSV